MTRRHLFAGIDKLDEAEAEAEAAIAKARLGETVAQIKDRLAPSHILEDAIGGVKSKSTQLAETASQAARARPAAVAAGLIGVVLLVARRPLFRLIGRLFSRR